MQSVVVRRAAGAAYHADQEPREYVPLIHNASGHAVMTSVLLLLLSAYIQAPDVGGVELHVSVPTGEGHVTPAPEHVELPATESPAAVEVHVKPEYESAPLHDPVPVSVIAKLPYALIDSARVSVAPAWG